MVPQGILKKICYVNLWRVLVCDTWEEEEEEEEEEEQEQETRTCLFVAGELGCGGSHNLQGDCGEKTKLQKNCAKDQYAW